jgi:hypothetical protein
LIVKTAAAHVPEICRVPENMETIGQPLLLTVVARPV